MFQFDHPFFRPLAVRTIVVLFCVSWGIFELVTGGPFWAIIFLALGGYAAYHLFIDFNPEASDKEDRS